MAHYAFLKDNLVVEVIVGKDEDDLDTLPEGFTDWEQYYESVKKLICKRTSFNTFGNQHTLDGTAFRGNYAGIGFTYDEENDVFIAPKPFDSWVLNTSTWLWEAPVAVPDDADENNRYEWDESSQNWISI